jgi:SAM-dependent methyltransferase
VTSEQCWSPGEGIVPSVSLASRAPARVRSLLGPVVEHVVYQDRLYDQAGEPLELGAVRRAALRVNQSLIERGRTPPWVWSREECERFWRSSGAGTEGNRPQDYASKDDSIVDFLDGFWRPEVSVEDSILEIGCNAGTNLHRLGELGFRHLGGVELNEEALEVLRSTYPDLAQSAELHLGAAEDALRALPDNCVDVVFTMAVLLHIHPSGAALFRDLVRVTRKYICTIEAESALAAYVFPRNYDRVFSRLGCTEVKRVRLARSSHPEVGFGYFGYTARLMRVDS